MSETELHQYFTQLKARYNLPDDIQLNWMPSDECKYHGMTSKDLKSIFIFDEELEQAKKTLKHELLEVLLTSLALVLADSKLSRDERYQLKERVIDIVQNAEEMAKWRFFEGWSDDLR